MWLITLAGALLRWRVNLFVTLSRKLVANRANHTSRAGSATILRCGFKSAGFPVPPQQQQLILSVTSAASLPTLHRCASLALCCHMTAYSPHGPNHTEEMITGQEVAA